jgi:hypothetical protein
MPAYAAIADSTSDGLAGATADAYQEAAPAMAAGLGGLPSDAGPRDPLETLPGPVGSRLTL